MREIEDRYQLIADSVIEGVNHLTPEQMLGVKKYQFLCGLRHSFGHAPVDDLTVLGVHGRNLTLDQEEALESKHLAFIRQDGKIPARVVAGLDIQRAIDQSTIMDVAFNWRVIRAIEGEFLHPDAFGSSSCIPVTPKILLGRGDEPLSLSRTDVIFYNRRVMSSCASFAFARDLNECVL